MSLRPLELTCVLILFTCQAGAKLSSWDESQLQLLEPYSTPLRWDNIEGPPYWVSGPKPRYQLGQRRHVIRMQPGDELTLRADACTWLRLVGEARTLQPEDFEIRVSTDARMFVESTSIKTTDPYALLIELPRDAPSLIRLTRPLQAASNLVFAAYFSRVEPFDTLAPYRSTVRLPGSAIHIRREGEAASQPAWALEPAQGLEFELEGPARLQLVARLRWPDTEPMNEQSLVIQIAMDGSNPVPLLLCPELDIRHRTWVNHSTELVSRRMNGFFRLPEGKHYLHLRTSAPVYVSVFQQSQPDLLLPGLNGPTTNTIPMSHPHQGWPSEVSATESKHQLPPLSPGNLAAMEQKLWQLARNNKPVETGAQAADWMNRLAQSRQDYPTAQRSAWTMRRQRTIYREILPAQLPESRPMQQASFAPNRLRSHLETDPGLLVYNPTLEQVESLLAQGHFAAVPAERSPGILYELPSRSYDSQLRIAVQTPSAVRSHLLIQFDQETPFRIAIGAASALPEQQLKTSEAIATLQVLKDNVQLPNGMKFGHPIGEFDLPAPIVQPGVVELPLPKHVRRVRILREGKAESVSISVAYRAARAFQYGEAGYLALLEQVGRAAAMRMLAHPDDTSETASIPERELRNHLLPLARRLQSYVSDFTNNVQLPSLNTRDDRDVDGEAALKLKNSALSLKQEGQGIEAMRFWNQLFWKGNATDQLQAALAIMSCLHSLGEDFLARQYALYVLLKSTDPETQAPAINMLEANARTSDDVEQLEKLRSFLFVQCPCPQHLKGLTEALALNGQEELALFAGLMLSRDNQPAEPMLGAALRQNWWQTFDRLLEGLTKTDAKHFWRAQKHLAFYRFVEAEQELRQAGGRGLPMLEALQQGLEIRKQLDSPEQKDRFGALLAWEEWQEHQPGPCTWSSARDVLQASSATELLFNCEQNRFTTYLRAERKEPIILRFLGPLRLQVAARPILATSHEQRVNDWLEFVEYGITNRVPISQYAPNPSLQLLSSPEALVGIKTVATLQWGPGWHEVAVSLADHSGLIHVLQEQPVLPTRVLPTLSARRFDLVLRNAESPLPEENPRRLAGSSDFWWVKPEMARRSVSVDQVGTGSGSDLAAKATVESGGLSDVQRLRVALRMEAESKHPFEYDIQAFRALPPYEQWLAACRGKRLKDFSHWEALPDRDAANSWLAMGHIQEVLDSEVPRDVLQRLTTLLEISELFPSWRQQAQCLGELLTVETNCPPDGKSILFRLTQGRTWIPLTVSPLSAGIRPIRVPSDQVQNPSMRVRRALLPPSGNYQFTLSGQGEFAASMNLLHPARLELRAKLVKAGFSPLTPLTVSMQVDDQEARRLPLGPSMPETETRLTLPEGPHLVRAWIVDPVVNHWVRITLSGDSNESTNAVWSQALMEMAEERRFFYAATPAQPIRFSWRGPALLRLDEDREGRIVSQLRWVPAGEQMVEIPPASGREESWYQIFVRNTQTNQVETRLASTVRMPKEVPPPKLQLPESLVPSQAQLTDHYRLGGQEDGTWTPSVLLAHRRPFEISSSQNTVENEFVEANMAYRKASPNETTWFKTEALARLHRPGDLTFGISERVEGHPQSLPFDWSWIGEAFAGTVGSHQQDVQWALHTGLELGKRIDLNRKLDWYSSAGVFARYLSLDPASASQYHYIDQDLYTSFKEEQKWGGVLGSQLEYRPWLDTALRGGAFLMSNEDFTPDNWGMRLSWTQLMGPFRGQIAYRFRYFLNDADRSSALLLQGVSAGLFAEHWVNGRHRIELGVRFSHDWPDSGNSYYLVLRCDFSQGRGYKDYSPHETVFRNLRSRRIPAAFNNLLQLAPAGIDQP